MKARGLQTEYVASPLDSVGDHPALNFINTLRMDGSELSDTWQSDEELPYGSFERDCGILYHPQHGQTALCFEGRAP